MATCCRCALCFSDYDFLWCCNDFHWISLSLCFLFQKRLADKKLAVKNIPFCYTIWLYCFGSRLDSYRSWQTALDYLRNYENSGRCYADARNSVFILFLYGYFHFIIINYYFSFEKTDTNGSQTLRPYRPSV